MIAVKRVSLSYGNCSFDLFDETKNRNAQRFLFFYSSAL